MSQTEVPPEFCTYDVNAIGAIGAIGANGSRVAIEGIYQPTTKLRPSRLATRLTLPALDNALDLDEDRTMSRTASCQRSAFAAALLILHSSFSLHPSAFRL